MKGWHFLRKDRQLRYGDNRIVEAGETYSVPDDRPLELCEYGLHASRRLTDALGYAPGSIICRVQLIGKRIDGDDKSVAYRRRVDWMFDATDVLCQFARRCALDVIHLWDAPDVVVQYLKTGDESIQKAAESAAESAPEFAANAARTIARDATRSAANAARSAAESAAKSAAWSASEFATWLASRDKQNRRLTAMVMAERNRYLK